MCGSGFRGVYVVSFITEGGEFHRRSMIMTVFGWFDSKNGIRYPELVLRSLD
jgi:hypothetical protein